ncbi:MAG TPA: hypothetical protein VKU01_01095 [Bryobacteraceae bacterium]|nr:hypothetical protein [Bryobacteraceae bacterium]
MDAVPRQGYMVPEIPFHAVCDTFEVRLILEAAIAELATLRADDSEIEELARLAAHRYQTENRRTISLGCFPSIPPFTSAWRP